MNIYPLIRHIDHKISLEQSILAQHCGADGVFFVSQSGNDESVLIAASEARRMQPQFQIGINLGHTSPLESAVLAADKGLDMLLVDSMGVTSNGLSSRGQRLADFASNNKRLKFFSSFSFCDGPDTSRTLASEPCFYPTLHNDRECQPPRLDDIIKLSMESGGKLVMADGITPDTIVDYAPYLDSVLVTTVIAKDALHFDVDKLKRFVMVAKKRLKS